MNLIPKPMLQRAISFTIILAVGILLIAIPVHANSGIGSSFLLFQLPLWASLFSFGVGFLLILLLEGRILRKRESIQLWRAIRLVAEANLLSTFAGFALLPILGTLLNRIWEVEMEFEAEGWSWLVWGKVGLGRWSWLVWGMVILFFLGVGICTSGFMKRLTPLWSVHFLWWSGVWVVVLLGPLILVGPPILGSFTGGMLPGAFIAGMLPTTVLKLLVFANNFLIGFLLSIVVEGFWLASRLPKKITLSRTILLMNVRSYAYIVVPIISLLFIIFD
jgi:hypothetical protein